MSSIPVDSVHHIEDVGHLLLEAQKDLARVRQRLDAMPLDSDASADGSAAGSAALTQLRDLLQQTESQLRSKAEVVLRSVEDNRLNTLPAVTSSSAGSAAAALRYPGDFDLASVIVQPMPSNALIASPARTHSSAATAASLGGSPMRRHASSMSATQQAHMRRPVGERMAESRALEFLARAPNEAQLGSGYGSGSSVAREFVQDRYGPARPDPLPLAPSAQIASSPGSRPIEKYGRAWREQRVHKGSRLTPTILPKMYRSNPRSFPAIGPADADTGVLSLVQRGYIPSFVDVTAAFTSNPAPLSAAPAPFHHYAEQFKKAANHTAAPHAPFNLSQVRLDLAEAILDGGRSGQNEYERMMDEREKQQQQLLLQAEEKQQQPPQPFDFPRLMPGSSDNEEEQRMVLSEASPTIANDVDDLLYPSDSLTSSALDEAPPAVPPREYDELLDAYSLHQFLIRKGKVLQGTPEFQSFARKNQHAWGQVKVVLTALENLCKEYKISLATVSGQAVAELAEDELAKLTPERLFRCFHLDAATGLGMGQSDPVLHALLSAPAKARYALGGDVARLLAALKIQSTWRMFLQRRLYILYRFRHTKAIVIQRVWRRFQTVLRTRQTIAQRWASKLEAWRSMQKAWKDSWGNFQSKARVHVHVPSISTEAYQRLACFNLGVKENASLSRLCDAADPLVDVLYISPFPLSMDVQSYYLKLLEVGGVRSVHQRVKVLVPENAPRFPEHFSLAKQALYSPKLIRKIREHLRGRPGVIVPGDVGSEDLQLAVELGLPMLGAEPDTIALFASKSGSKRIFAAAEVSVAPGAHDIYDENDLLSYLSRLVVEHLSVQRWILKIDNESGGRGCAMVDTRHFKVVASIRAEKEQHANRWHLPEVIANAQERVVVALKRGLSRKAVLATPGLYDQSWANFSAAFFRVGGVIEAAPPVVIGSPSVNMLIEPDGSVNILNSHDQVFSAPCVFGGAVCPSSAPADLIHLPALAIGRQAFREGVIGYVGVDFIAWSSGGGSAPRVWAVDLNLRYTPTQSSFALFQFLTKGRYVYQLSSLMPHASAKEREQVAVHLRPPARYVVKNGTDSTSQASHSRSGSRSGGSGAAAARGLSASASGRDSSRPTSSGSSTPKLPDVLGRSGSSASLIRAAGAPTSSESDRFYACVPYVYQPHLATLQFGSFFQLCRLRGIAFDVRARVGTAFVLMDSLASGSMGLISVGMGTPPSSSVQASGNNAAAAAAASSSSSIPPSPLAAMQTLVDSLAFLQEQVSSLRLGAHLYDSEANLSPMLLAFRGLVKAQREANHMLIMEQHTTNITSAEQ